MRIRADHVGVHERRPVALAAILHGALKGGRTRHRIGAVDFFKMEIGEARDQPRNAASGGLYFHGHGDRVAVILNTENHRKLVQCRGVHRLPELALAGGAIAERNVRDLVALEGDLFELAIIGAVSRRRNFRRVGALRKIASGLGASLRPAESAIPWGTIG